jgi:hypothetical protein
MLSTATGETTHTFDLLLLYESAKLPLETMNLHFLPVGDVEALLSSKLCNKCGWLDHANEGLDGHGCSTCVKCGLRNVPRDHVKTCRKKETTVTPLEPVTSFKSLTNVCFFGLLRLVGVVTAL